MINLKKIFSVIIISFLCLTESNALIKDSLFATVGNRAITHTDIVKEIKIILISRGLPFSEERREQIQTAAVKEIIKRNIKQIEIEKYKSLSFSQEELNKKIEQLAGNLKTDLDTLKNTFITNGIDFSNIIEIVKTDLLWNSLIFQLYKNRLTINFEEIDEQLKLIENKKESQEYLISEIIIKPVSKEILESVIKKIKNKIEIEGFENVAIDLSISETSFAGGDLGWINENSISERLKSKIINTPIGNVSEPILLPEGIFFFKVRDKRKSEKVMNIEDIKNQLVDTEKNKILHMHSLSHYDNLRRTISVKYY